MQETLTRTNRQNSFPSRFSQRSSTTAHPYRVGNIGQNGALYLRPVSRETLPAPFPSPPMTPQEMSDMYHGREALDFESSDLDERSLISHSVRTEHHLHLPYTPPSPDPEAAHPSALLDQRDGDRNNNLKSEAAEPQPSKPQVLVERARKRSKPQTSLDFLHIPIPHYRLGTPRFDGMGIPTLHSSIRTTSALSVAPASTIEREDHDPSAAQQSFTADALTNDIVLDLTRVTSKTGEVLAATPSGLVEKITSCVDYQLLSDFFLTFRSYMTSRDLVNHLVSRLRWAVETHEDFGRVVRVRTFVALRHWILNYFVDDFACDYDVRVQFCSLVNQLCHELSNATISGRSDLTVFAELKRCWKRTCALYWDMDDHNPNSTSDDIAPGGLLGSRNASVDAEVAPEQQQETSSRRFPDAKTFHQSRSSPPNLDTSIPIVSQKSFSSTPYDQDDTEFDTVSRYSDESADIVWCTLPRRAFNKSRVKSTRPHAPRPSSAGATPSSSSKQPHRPRYLTTYLEHHTMVHESEKSPPSNLTRSYEESTRLMVLPFPGSLIRGVVLPPASPIVTGPILDEPIDEKLYLGIERTDDFGSFTEYSRSFASPNSPSVRKFFDPIRRALSGRKDSISYQSGDVHQKPARFLADSRADRRSTPKSSPAHTATTKQQTNGRSQTRIDVLAANISESFKQALKDDAEAQRAKAEAKNVMEDSRPQSEHLSIETVNANPVANDDVMRESDERRRSNTPTALFRTLSDNILVEPGNVHSSAHDNIISDKTFNDRPIDLGVPIHASIPIADTPEAKMWLDTGTYLKYGPEFAVGNIAIPTVAKSQAGVGDVPMDNVKTSLSLVQLDAEAKGKGSTKQEVTEMTLDSWTVPTSEETTKDPFYLDRLPQIRRQPGGDLRAANHVRSLLGPRHRESLDAVSDLSYNMSGSPVHRSNTASQVFDQELRAGTPLGTFRIIPTPPIDETASLSSFEAKVLKLAELPDNLEDDGGVEAALSKLEGRSRAKVTDSSMIDHLITDHGFDGSFSEGRRYGDDDLVMGNLKAEQQAPIQQESRAASYDSYCSIPLLERDVKHPPFRRRLSAESLALSVPAGIGDDAATAGTLGNADENVGNSTGVRNTSTRSQSFDSAMRPDFASTSPGSHQFFFLDDHESLHSQAGIIEVKQARAGAGSAEITSFYKHRNGGSSHLSGPRSSLQRHLDTPLGLEGSTLAAQNVDVLSVKSGHRQSPPRHVPMQNRVDLYARAAADVNPSKGHPIDDSGITAQNSPLTPSISSHLPFILCYDALVLAQQFTLIEKDALSEIDWRELIDLRWRNSSSSNRNWVEYLKDDKAAADQRLRGGVDICISRFNIMVKWAISQILLTQDLSERAACIVRYIHIAHYCRRFRNYATVFQIAMALLGSDVSRLKQTWAKVPAREQDMLNSLEQLISPMRNFHNLRSEMEMTESAFTYDNVSSGSGGIIPFLGLYTHDLIYNAQKPAFLSHPEGTTAKSGDGEPLINFKRHCVAARIVKELLELVEASVRYNFEPQPQVLSRCLWMSALSDAEIVRRSNELEA